MNGTVLQINVSRGGLPKLPVEQALMSASGLDGDSHDHPQYHGGPNKAVLMIAAEALRELQEAGFGLVPGSLGENITAEGLDHRAWRPGQRWRIGEHAVIELTKLRVPCRTLSRYGRGIQKAVYDELAQEGDPSSPHWAIGGFYASVFAPGIIRAGDPIVLQAI